MTYRERRLRRADRLREWAEKRAAKSAASFTTAHRIADAIPFGQPILVGHHSERYARRDQERIHHAMAAGIEHERTAASMTSRADEVERQAEQAIYSDDLDAIERLREKIASLEAERDRIKAINSAIRKGAGWESRITPPLNDRERNELLMFARVCPYHEVDKRGFPSYVLQNLSGNLARARQRVAQLEADRKPLVLEQRPTVDGATAIARAGLRVEAGMTTPAKAWKKPRPVWTVAGSVAFWKPLLLELGGNVYRGSISFWDDPTDDLDARLLAIEAEQRATVTRDLADLAAVLNQDTPLVADVPPLILTGELALSSAVQPRLFDRTVTQADTE
jgi:hypothetical protein